MLNWQWWGKTFDRRPRTIRFRIGSLVVLILIPLFGLFAWLAVSLAAAQRDLIELQRLDTTNKLSAAVDLDIAEKLGMLRGLSGSDAIKNNAFEEFRRQSDIVLEDPEVTAIWLFKRDGEFVAGAFKNKPEGSAEPLDRQFADAAFAGKNAVSMVRGEGTGNATVVVAVPVFDRQDVAYGLAGEIRIAHLSRIFSDIGMDPRWVAAVVDRTGRFVARSMDAESRIGQRARPELGAAARGFEASGSFENVTWEGLLALNAFRRSTLTGWTSVVAVPKDDLAAPFRDAVVLTILGAVAVLTITLLSGMAMASRISEPVRNLSRYARALAGGHPYREVTHHIAELDEVRTALDMAMAKNAHLAALIASSGDAIISMGLDGTIRTWNRAAGELFGYMADEVIGKPKTLIVPKDQLDDFGKQRAKILNGELVHSETVRVTKNGTRVPVLLNAAPVRQADGKIIAMSSIIHDITALKAAEAHRLILMRELAHRSKNQLAVIQSIAGQTGRNAVSLDSFLVDFRQRLQGIAVSHDILARGNWRAASLIELIRRQLAPFVGEDSNRVVISGPPIDISASAAEAIGLALHELATNSTKYGALSKPEGTVDVRWTLTSNGSTSGAVSLEWTEKNGPPIEEPPRRKGFGSRIIESLVASAVSGNSIIEYRREGVYWRLMYEHPGAETEFWFVRSAHRR